MSSAPPDSSLCRCMPSSHVMQCVAPTSNAIVSGSWPVGQYWQSMPVDENFPGVQTSHTVCSAFGARPAGHASQMTPDDDTQPLELLKKEASVHATQRSAIVARELGSIRGCVPSGHCSQTPATPAEPAGQASHDDRTAVGIMPSSQAPHATRSDVYTPGSRHGAQLCPSVLNQPSSHAEHRVRLTLA